MTQQGPPRPTPPRYKPPIPQKPQWVEEWPCICNRGDRVWHKHYADGKHSCARCGHTECSEYRPDISEKQAIRILLGPVMSNDQAVTILMGPKQYEKGSGMNEQQKKVVLEMLEKPDVNVTFMRGIKDVTAPGNEWQEFEVSKALYLVISIGPTDSHVENAIRAALGHDPMNFVR